MFILNIKADLMHVMRVKVDINLYPIIDFCSLVINSLYKMFIKVVPSTIKNHLRCLFLTCFLLFQVSFLSFL